MSMLTGVRAEPASDDDFYAGKTVRIILGTTTAGEYGLYALLMAGAGDADREVMALTPHRSLEPSSNGDML